MPKDLELTLANWKTNLFPGFSVGGLLSRNNVAYKWKAHEYNDVWVGLTEKLESWIEANDAELEVPKDEPLPKE